jgi:hypothetical protein
MYYIVVKRSCLEYINEIIDNIINNNITIINFYFNNHIKDNNTNLIIEVDDKKIISIESIFNKKCIIKTTNTFIHNKNQDFFYLINKNILSRLKRKKIIFKLINLNNFTIRYFSFGTQYILNIDFYSKNFLDSLNDYKQININLDIIKNLILLYEFNFNNERVIKTFESSEIKEIQKLFN